MRSFLNKVLVFLVVDSEHKSIFFYSTKDNSPIQGPVNCIAYIPFAFCDVFKKIRFNRLEFRVLVASLFPFLLSEIAMHLKSTPH